MKKIKEWWKKINMPDYKKPLEELESDAKKAMHTTWIFTGFTIFLIILVYKVVSDIASISFKILRIDGISIEIIIIVVMAFIIVTTMVFLFFANMIFNISNRSDIMLVLKHLSIQLKLNENQQEVICKHRFLDIKPETKCVLCGKTLLETKEKEEKK